MLREKDKRHAVVAGESGLAADGPAEVNSLPDECQSLVPGLRRQDPHALNRLIDLVGGQVVHLARLILGAAGRPEDAEEIASDVFCRVWQQIDDYNPRRTSLRSWVLMLTKYTALDRRRALVRERYTPTGEARVVSLHGLPEPEEPVTPEAEALRVDRRERLHEALTQLPAAERELIIRRYFFEEPISALAQDAGVSRHAMDNRLWRARQALQAIMNRTEGAAR